MPIESGTTLAELDESWPLSNDNLIEGDNHLRLLKQVLKDQFPGALGEGLASVITSTEAEMNFLVGVTSSIQDQLDAIVATDNNRYPVGHQVIGTNPDDPSTYGYPGVWTLIDDDAVLSTGGVTGQYAGENDVDVPLLQHNHSASSSFSGNALPTHNHKTDGQTATTFKPGSVGATSGGNYNTGTLDAISAGTPSGSVSTSIVNAGTANAKMNVQGKRYNVIIWERTA